MALRATTKLKYLNGLFRNPPSPRCYPVHFSHVNYSSNKTRFPKEFSQPKIVMEVSQGVGGQEAMLFAKEMFGIYTRYAVSKRWQYNLAVEESSDLGGLKKGRIEVLGYECYEDLIHEAGVHRVQRQPINSSRLHTSTITVAVVPLSVLNVQLHDKDIEVQTMRSQGAGGQHVNKTESAIRLVHKASGAVVECQTSRSQKDNLRIAKEKLFIKLQELEMDKIHSTISSMRKSQVGHADRNEKIRTYNFPQDRITEHRIKKTYYNLRSLFEGNTSILDKIIQDLKNAQGAESAESPEPG